MIPFRNRVHSRALAALASLALVAAGFGASVAIDATPAGAVDVTTDAQLRSALGTSATTHIDIKNDIAMTCGSGTFSRFVGNGPLLIDGHSHKVDATGCTVRVFDVESSGALTLSHLLITGGNEATSGSAFGGGMERSGGDLTLDHVEVSGNQASTTSAASAVEGAGIDATGNVTIIRSLIAGNSGSCSACPTVLGGGISERDGSAQVTIVASTIAGNSASAPAGNAAQGGGLFGGIVNVASSTIADNTVVGTGNQGANFRPVSTGSLFGSVIAYPHGATNCSFVTNGSSAGYNWADDTSCLLTATGDHSSGDPLLDALVDNGGFTRTRLPHLGTSPVIGVIPADHCQDAGASGIITDQRDKRRPETAAGACDIGAAELGNGAVPGTYTPLTPVRILDTRSNLGGLPGPFNPQQSKDLTVTGGATTVPASGVEAVLLNVTAVGPTAPGWLTLFPAGSALPVASNLNFDAGQTVPNLVLVRLGHGGTNEGKISINNTGGSPNAGFVNVIADVQGYYRDATLAAAGQFTGITPFRVLDTRPNSAFSPGEDRDLLVGDGTHVPSDAAAVVINLTATGPTAAGWLTAHPAGTTVPLAANLNFVAGQTVPNLVTVGMANAGHILISNTATPSGTAPGAGFVHVIGDVVGYYKAATGSSVTPIAPQRILDTRTGTGGVTGPVAPHGTITVDPKTASFLPPVGSYTAVAVNVVATGPTAPGWLTAYPSGQALPLAANLNFVAGQSVGNLVKIAVGPDGTFSITNTDIPGMSHPPAGSVHVVVDIVGYYGVT